MLRRNTINRILKIIKKIRLLIFLIQRKLNNKTEWERDDIKELIQRVAEAEEVDTGLALNVAFCESGYNPFAVNINYTWNVDRGLYQWNNYYHPEITDEMAFDPYIATKEFCKAVKQGNLSWWNSSKVCWNR